jgi:ribokinase
MIVNLGSLNIDRVFRVPHIVSGGETIASHSFVELAGGKGANQSVALARAGAKVAHIGRVGPDGAWLVEKLAREGIDTRWISKGNTPTGQAMIQIDDAGQNAIVLHAGANREITAADIDAALDEVPAGSWFLVQNETSGLDHALSRAGELGLRVAFNPAPCDRWVLESRWPDVALLCVNETEAMALGGEMAPDRMLAALARQAPRAEIILTLGKDGAWYYGPLGSLRVAAHRVSAVDTTAAGDTFLGYFLASRSRGLEALDCLELATSAAALCVSRPGAMDSIPMLAEVLAWRDSNGMTRISCRDN